MMLADFQRRSTVQFFPVEADLLHERIVHFDITAFGQRCDGHGDRAGIEGRGESGL